MFEGLFDKGRPFDGAWTSPNKVKTPYLAAAAVKQSAANVDATQSAAKTTSRSKSDPYLVFALEMVCIISATFLSTFCL